MTAYGYKDNIPGTSIGNDTLSGNSGSITSGATSLKYATTPNDALGTAGLRSTAPFVVAIGTELIIVGANTAGTKTASSLTRGAFGTTAAAHNDGDAIDMVLNAQAFLDELALKAAATHTHAESDITSLVADLASVSLHLIRRVVVGTDVSAPAASVTVSSIPGTYKNLLVRVLGRGDAVATSVGIKLQFNGDTGSNYSTQNLQAAATAVSGSEGIAITAMTIGNITAASAPANAPGAVTCHVLQYASTLFDKISINPWFMRRATTTGNVFTGFLGGVWFPSTPAAITSIAFLLSSGNFITGTVIEVYGEG